MHKSTVLSERDRAGSLGVRPPLNHFELGPPMVLTQIFNVPTRGAHPPGHQAQLTDGEVQDFCSFFSP